MQPLTDAVDRYTNTNQAVQSPRTVRSHQANLRLLGQYLGRPPLVSDLNDDTVAGYWRDRGTRVGRNTLNGEAGSLLALWRWCAMRGLCDPPTIAAPPRIKRTPRALSKQQITELWRVAARTNQVVGNVPGRVYWPAILYTLWCSGERIGAVRALDWACIDLSAGWVTFPAETRKFGTEEVTRPLTPSAVAALRLLQNHSQYTPFGAVEGTGFYHLWHALRAEAGLPEWVTPHTIRKSVASHLPSLDDACEMLGHSSSATTRRNYRDPRVADNRELLGKLFDPAEEKKRRNWLNWLTG